MSILIQMQSIFQEVFDKPGLQLSPEMNPNDIPEWDSVAQIMLVLAIERSFDFHFAHDEVSGFHTVGDFMTALEKRSGAV
jgi:acyl carrier protein